MDHLRLSRKVEELSLDFSDGDPIDTQLLIDNPKYVLPKFLYENGTTIRVLNLYSSKLGICNFGNVSNLKTLALSMVRILIGEVIHILNI